MDAIVESHPINWDIFVPYPKSYNYSNTNTK